MKKFLYHGKKNICGDRIRMARLEKRLSQTDLARLLQLEGVPMERDVISRMEMGDRLVTDYEVVTIAEVLDVRAMDIRERMRAAGVKITPAVFPRKGGKYELQRVSPSKVGGPPENRGGAENRGKAGGDCGNVGGLRQNHI